MDDNEILLGTFNDNNILNKKIDKDEKYEEVLISYKDKNTNEIVIKFVRKPKNKNKK